MDPLKRNNPGVRATNHEDRIQALERRIPEDFPQWNSMALDSITESASGTYPFSPTFPSDDPCVLPDCDPDDWRTDGDYLLLPSGMIGVTEVYLVLGVTGGNSNLDEFYTLVDAADQGINGQCHGFITAELWRNDAPFGSMTGRAFSTWNEIPPPMNSTAVDRIWTHHTIIANNAFSNVNTDRIALKASFFINQALPGTITVGGSMSVAAHVVGSRLNAYGGIAS